ncbi:WXG100 family type VII secretion target [Paenibacillus soyae]|uniref:WXG100 family type VII secretion target n=1 Tax=Paenibacillus soyae TaxID=2969249 RepID=A0A9X2MNL7_9BACL|nr:WXG100 family type VII secretion target [Paenibacillus soyae]MCR2803399.1 WXG100 family type VII secretion target [Paenibacillus soyae]
MSVSPYEIHRSASSVYDSKADVSELKRDIHSLITGSDSYWTGKANKTFQESGDIIASKLKTVVSLMDDLVGELRALGNEVAEAEARRAEAARLAELERQKERQKAK